jgi:hypothetical protein
MDSHDKTLTGGAGGIAGFFNSLLGKAKRTVRKATKKTVAKKPAAKKPVKKTAAKKAPKKK